MRKFQFQYQKILDLRQKEVDSAKAVYGKAVKDFEAARKQYEQYKADELDIQREIASCDSMTSHDLHTRYHYLMRIKQQKEQQLVKVNEYEKYMKSKQQELVNAYKEEKKWDKLSEIEKEEYVAEQIKIEQSVLDEISIQRYIMKNY